MVGHLVISSSVWFFRWATMFCLGVWGRVSFLWMPFTCKKFSNSILQNFVPLFDRIFRWKFAFQANFRLECCQSFWMFHNEMYFIPTRLVVGEYNEILSSTCRWRVYGAAHVRLYDFQQFRWSLRPTFGKMILHLISFDTDFTKLLCLWQLHAYYSFLF